MRVVRERWHPMESCGGTAEVGRRGAEHGWQAWTSEGGPAIDFLQTRG